ncbi:uncharacterized protein si:dkey-256h2.1 [Erpetoichthys calabaricus]|uniref:Si:dkey-256h2.1 n=1 Tax=Erpetoichthys calabaricus TaxID=27687 RepID=A0A8C4SN20_ERPCA|nr:uncharacterized protein si:dkey-256h2.1 [Erpetoichthys calabaricus]
MIWLSVTASVLAAAFSVWGPSQLCADPKDQFSHSDIYAFIRNLHNPKRTRADLERSGSRNVSEGKQAGYEPNTPAPPFKVHTLDEQFVYPPADKRNFSLLVHAFTNKSAFLECLWTSESSLTDLVTFMPNNTHLLFLSFDDSASRDALWMKQQILNVTQHSKREDLMSRLHFGVDPVFDLGNWIPDILNSWRCDSSNCGYKQVNFSSAAWDVPIVEKRLDARYDWLMKRWKLDSYVLQDGGNGCTPSTDVNGSVAWVSEDSCSYFTKVKNMAESGALGVLVYAGIGEPIKDMNCKDDECSTSLDIPASMVHIEPAVVKALQTHKRVNVSFQNVSSSGFFFGIDRRGRLAEMGWLLFPTFRFLAWQAQWFDYFENLEEELEQSFMKQFHIVNVFNNTVMQGEAGAIATVELPKDLKSFDILELDASLSCPGSRDETCAHWDHTVQLFVCCNPLSPYCNLELGRWITPFRRRIGRWLTDVSPLIPLLDSTNCTFTMKTAPWAMPWKPSLNIRMGKRKKVAADGFYSNLIPFKLQLLFEGGTFDKNYNKHYQPISFSIPPLTKKVELYAVITGHGSDENDCCEFCVTSHHFVINSKFNISKVFDNAGTPFGCAEKVPEGVVPNERGTWLYGRAGWCDGQDVAPWRTDITDQVDMMGDNIILYFGWYNGTDPNPTKEPGYIIMYSYLVFYK